MIHVSLSALIILYLLILLGGLSIVWLIGEVRQGRHARVLRRYWLKCQVCGYRYEDRSDKALPECPECGRPNERQTLNEI